MTKDNVVWDSNSSFLAWSLEEMQQYKGAFTASIHHANRCCVDPESIQRVLMPLVDVIYFSFLKTFRAAVKCDEKDSVDTQTRPGMERTMPGRNRRRTDQFSCTCMVVSLVCEKRKVNWNEKYEIKRHLMFHAIV